MTGCGNGSRYATGATAGLLLTDWRKSGNTGRSGYENERIRGPCWRSRGATLPQRELWLIQAIFAFFATSLPGFERTHTVPHLQVIHGARAGRTRQGRAQYPWGERTGPVRNSTKGISGARAVHLGQVTGMTASGPVAVDTTRAGNDVNSLPARVQ